MSTLLLEVKRRMVNLTSKIDYSQKGTLIKENINWLLESRSMRIKESEVKCEIKARKLHWWRMEFPFRHVGACMHVFIFPKYLRCLDEQRHASALPGKFHLCLFWFVIWDIFLLILLAKCDNSALGCECPHCCPCSDDCNLTVQKKCTPACDLG